MSEPTHDPEITDEDLELATGGAGEPGKYSERDTEAGKFSERDLDIE